MPVTALSPEFIAAISRIEAPVLIIPGISNSGPQHWQSLWQQQDASLVRVPFAEWDEPDRLDWVATIDASVRALGPDTIIVAHSLGCLAVAHWAAEKGAAHPVAGALLVAVPDPLGPNFPTQARNFTSLPRQSFPFASLIVSSDDDPYSSASHVAAYAQAWGSDVTSIGARGHINAGSGLGDWPEGRRLLQALRAKAALAA